MRTLRATVLAITLLLLGLCFANAQEVIDRIVARVDTDIILLSEVRELSRYQQFVDGRSESDAQVLDRLVDQWIVRTEAKASLFPLPSDEEVNRSLERLQRSFSSPEAYEERKKLNGLSDEGVRRMLRSQLYLSNYLDSRFRASIRIDDQAIQEFYQNRVVPRAESRGQTPPTLDAARDFIQEALVQRAINVQADKWLKESRARLHLVNLLGESPQ
jgi:parvulin-like peptidyl-prolyl isomerase